MNPSDFFGAALQLGIKSCGAEDFTDIQVNGHNQQTD